MKKTFLILINLLLYSNSNSAQKLYIDEDIQQHIDSVGDLFWKKIKRQEFLDTEKIAIDLLHYTEYKTGTESLWYGVSLRELGRQYYYTGKFNKCKELYTKSLNIITRATGQDNYQYYRTAYVMGGLFNNIAMFDSAVYYLKICENGYRNILPLTDERYISVLRWLGKSYLGLGKYHESEKCFEKIIELCKIHPNISRHLLGIAYYDMGQLYLELGQYEKSEHTLINSLSFLEKYFDREDNSDYSWALAELAKVYYQAGRWDESVKTYKKVCTRRFAFREKYRHEYAWDLRNFGEILIAIHDYTFADSILQLARPIYEKLYPEPHSEYFKFLLDIAYLDFTENKLHLTLCVLDSIHNYYMKWENTCSSSVDANLFNAGVLYGYSGSFKKSEQLLDLCSKCYRSNLKHASFYLSEPEALKLYLKNVNKHDIQLSLLTNYHFSYNNLSKTVFENEITLKEMALNNSRILNLSDLNTPLFKQWKNICAEIYRAQAGNHASPLYIDSLNKIEYSIERELRLISPKFAELNPEIFLNHINKKIAKTESVIEFTHFRFHNKKGQSSDSILYSALVLFPQDTTPHFIPLFEEKQLQILLEKTGDNAQATTNLYAATRSGDLLGQAPSYGTELYNLIWKPIDSLLNSPSIGGGRGEAIKKVYFSPSGLLHRVAFAALPIDGKKVLADRYELHQLGSTRSLVVKTPEPVAQDYTAAIFGGVQYNSSGMQTDSTAPEITDNRLWTLIERPRSGVEDGFEFLPGTAQEAQLLEKTLAQNRIVTRSHTGAQATEEALKALGRDTVKSPDILHIATHGFFFPDPEKRKEQRFGEENAFKWNENPLFRSGLALAGANATWSGQPSPGNIEDGIATAYEISHLNLSNTKLVVLSACETGLGDIKGSEGVYGLQRAFKMAGADFLLVSLWQVPDKETVEFMDAFYGAWLKGKTIHEAFAKAQKKMRKKYKEVYKWGAWVLVE